MKKLTFTLAAILFFLGGCSDDKLIGTWVQPIPGMEDKLQGITLNKDGSAQSVNMHTLLYTGWQREGNILTLTGQSIGNGRTITIKEEFEIQQLDDHNLKLHFGNTVLNYTRQTSTGE